MNLPMTSSIRSPATAAAAPRNILNTRRYRLRNRAREAARVSDGLNLNEDISLAELTRMAPPRDVDEEEAMLAEALKLSLEQADSDAAAAASPSRPRFTLSKKPRVKYIIGQIDNPRESKKRPAKESSVYTRKKRRNSKRQEKEVILAVDRMIRNIEKVSQKEDALAKKELIKQENQVKYAVDRMIRNIEKASQKEDALAKRELMKQRRNSEKQEKEVILAVDRMIRNIEGGAKRRCPSKEGVDEG